MSDPISSHAGPLVDLAAVHAPLRHGLPEIMAEWTAIAAEEPWLALPTQYRTDSLPEVLGSVIDATFGDGDHDGLAHSLVGAAARHGESRREQAFDSDLLFREYYFLRHAVARYLCRTVDSPRCHDLLLDVDYVLTIAQRGSLYGYHRAELEKSGRWSDILTQAAGELRVLRARRS